MCWDRDVPVKLRMAETGPLAEKPICVMTALRTTAENYPNHPALGLYSFFVYCHSSSSSSDVALETEGLVSRHLEDKK